MDREQELTSAYNCRSEGANEKAIELFGRIAEDDRYRERALLELGKTYKMMNIPDKAIEYFAEAVRRYPHNEEAIAELGQTSRISARYDVAVAVLEPLAAGDHRNACIELSRIQFEKNELDRSLENLRKADRLIPGDSNVRIGFGRIYRKQNLLEKAAQEFNAILAASPDHREACAELGDLFYLRGDYGKAAEYFERAVRASGDRSLYLRLVEIYHLNGEPQKSDAAAEKVLTLTPGNAFDRDVMLNEIEILQRKTILKSRVKRLWVTVTSRCNIRCKTCGLWHGTWDLPYKTAKEVMAYYPYLERLVWLGGEVFLYRHFEEMFDEAARHPQLRQQVITNGYILNEKWIDKIVRSGNTELTFSIDGTTREVYESIRQGSNFDKVLKNVRRVMALKRECGSKMDVRMNAVIMRSNYHQIDDFLEFAHREGFNQVSLMALHFDLAPEENIFYDRRDAAIVAFIGKAIPRLRQKACRYAIDLDILLPPGEMEFDQAIERRENAERQQPSPETVRLRPEHTLYCKMPWRYMMLCDKGDVFLTGSCIKSIGNINQSSLDELWNSETAAQYRNRMSENRFEGFCRTECVSRWDV